MPIFRVKTSVVYFAHIPKCAGSTIAAASQDNGCPISFYDKDFWKPAPSPWYHSSPQHFMRDTVHRLFNDDFFDYKFAVARDPISRFLSAFNHNRKRIGYYIGLDHFLSILENRVAKHGDFFGERFDNHFEPASAFILNASKLFPLEQGLETILSQLETDLQISLASTHDHRNVKSYAPTSGKPLKRLLKRLILPPTPTIDALSQRQVSRITTLYNTDLKLFASLD